MNTELLSFISQSISTATANLFVFLLYKNLYGCKYKKIRYYILSYFGAVILMIAVNMIGNPFLNLAYSFISLNAICFVLFESDFKKIWANNLFFWFLFVLTDSATVAIWSIIAGSSFEGILSNYQLMIGSNILNIIFMFAVYRVYLTFRQKISIWVTQLKIALFVIFITFFQTWIMTVYASRISDKGDGITLIVMMTGFLLMNLFLAYILNQVSDAYRYKYELSLSERLNEMYLLNYMEISHKYEESKAIIHDIKKHLSVAEEMKDDKNAQTKYLSEVYDRMNDIFNFFHCSNKILSIILSQKISYAKSKGIKVKVSVEDVPMDFIRDFDITAIFANLWDNAIEACDKVNEGKYIVMDISRRNDFLLINIENSYNGKIIRGKDGYTSTKPDHDGMGLKSVRLVIEKYDGVFMTSYNAVAFRAEITLFLTEKENKFVDWK